MTRKRFTLIFALVILMLLAVTPLAAQDDGGDAGSGEPVTADEVNEVAEKLYCPVCEGIPLDTCGTAACEDWRLEIKGYLEEGWTEDQIVDDFIVRFGDRVVGVPDDPTLQTVSLGTPLLIIAVSLLAVLFVIARYRFMHRTDAIQAVAAAGKSKADAPRDEYRSMLEQDISG